MWPATCCRGWASAGFCQKYRNWPSRKRILSRLFLPRNELMLLRLESGQLLLPILAVLLRFELFWFTYVRWCRTIYWKMRMDAAADAVALSAAREQAAL